MSTYETKVGRNSKMADFDETLLVWPTHGWGWPPRIFLVWGHSCGLGSPTLGLILLLNPKIHVVARNGLDLIFCYILVKALIGNFRFRGCRDIFWRGHRCKKNSGLFSYAIAKPTRNVLGTPKRKFSYILIKELTANFNFWVCWIIFWRGHKCKKNSKTFFTPVTPSKNASAPLKLKICH